MKTVSHYIYLAPAIHVRIASDFSKYKVSLEVWMRNIQCYSFMQEHKLCYNTTDVFMGHIWSKALLYKSNRSSSSISITANNNIKYNIVEVLFASGWA